MGAESITLTGASESLHAGWTKYNAMLGYLLEGDGTKRVVRLIRITIADGTTASTIKVKSESIFNGDAIAEENNLAANGDTGSFNLDNTKSQLHIESTAITGNCTHTLLAVVYRNAGGNFPYCEPTVVSNGITLTFRNNDDSAYDLTSHVDTGNLYINVLYFTDS